MNINKINLTKRLFSHQYGMKTAATHAFSFAFLLNLILRFVVLYLCR